jgi:hypothetical protein
MSIISFLSKDPSNSSDSSSSSRIIFICNKHENDQVYKISWTTIRTWANLVLNVDCKIRKTRKITWHVQNRNPTRFYCKNETKTEQDYDKKMYPKLVLNILKVIKSPTSIYTLWGPNSLWWPMIIHV